MARGRIEDFHAGLSDHVGMPHPDVKRYMIQEQCLHGGCDAELTLMQPIVMAAVASGTLLALATQTV